MIRKFIGTLTAATILATTVSIPTTRASDELIRLGVGVGLGILNEAMKNGRQAPSRLVPTQRNTRQQSQKKSATRQQAQPAPKKPATVAKQAPAKPAPEPIPSAVAANSKTPAETMLLQIQLAVIGLAVGSADGVWGKATDDAISEFKKSRNLPDDISEELLKAKLAAAYAEKIAADAKVAAKDTNSSKTVAEASDGNIDPQKEYQEAVAAEGPVTKDQSLEPELITPATTISEAKSESTKIEPKVPVEEKKQPDGFTLSEDFN